MTINDFRKWIEERLKSAQDEVDKAYNDCWDNPEGELTNEQLDKFRRFVTIRDELKIIKLYLDTVRES